jgi:tetratricopeptide (TPR) repeat protein
MSGQPMLEGLHERYRRLLEALEAAMAADAAGGPPPERNAIRTDIVALFRETDSLITELQAFKEQIRELVSRFKSLPPLPAHPTRVDHLGSSTFLERGWSAIAAGEYEQAVRALRRSLELAPDETAAEVLLGWALMLQDEHDEALSLFQHVLARDPKNLMARANLGYICLKKGIFGEAIEHLSRVLRAGTDRKASLYANYYMGLLYLEREMYADARSFLLRALELGPNLTEAWWELGRACYLAGSPGDAADAWRRGAEANRHGIWGGRCARALRALEEGEPVSFT